MGTDRLIGRPGRTLASMTLVGVMLVAGTSDAVAQVASAPAASRPAADAPSVRQDDALDGQRGRLRELVRQARARGDRRIEMRMLDGAASLSERLGDYQEALDERQASLAIARAIGDREAEGTMLNDLGSLLHVLGRLPDAIETLKEAQRVQRLVNDRAGEANTLRLIARIEHVLKRRLAAQARAREALALFRAVGDREGEASTLSLIAQIANDGGDHAGALRTGIVAQAVCLSAGGGRCLTVTASAIGRAATALGQWDRAETQLRKALDLYRAEHNPSGQSSALYDLAHFERARGHLDAALAYVQQRLAIIESTRVRVAAEALRTSYLAARHDTYAFTIDLLMDMHAREPWRRYDIAAFDTSERARARTLLDLLVDASAGARPRSAETDPPRDLALNAAAPQGAASIEAALDTAVNAAPNGASPLTAADIQRDLLDDDTVLLQYALGPARSRLWLVTRQTVTTYTLPAEATIEAAAKRVYELLTVSQTRQRFTEARHAAADLGALLLGPAAARLTTKRLAIVADGALQFVPFGALRVNGAPLVLRHEIVNLPSASTLAVLRRELATRPPAPRLAAVLADPVLERTDPRVKGRAAGLQANANANARMDANASALASASMSGASTRGADLARSSRESGLTRFERLVYTRREAEVIDRLAGGAGSFVALDFNANRDTAIETNLGQFRILHFATHGLLNSRHPELSGLVLSLVDEEGRPRDGFLRAADIYALRLNADLVVLSACRTALGQEIKGEGLIGLVRAFMYAGSPRVVASLWDVRDEATAALMDRFYTGMIRDGLTPAAALRKAQTWMARSERWHAPYYWAGFVLQGEWR